MNILPGLSLTRQGNEVLINIKKTLNERTNVLANAASDWKATYGKLSSKNTDGQTWEQWKSKWYNENPLVTEDMQKTIGTLGNQIDEEFSDNVFTIDSDFINKHGKKFEKYRNKKIMVVGDRIFEI